MNMRELVKEVADEVGMPQEGVRTVLNTAFDTIKRTMPVEPVRISGFGTFFTKDVEERVRRNPFTGGEIVCRAHKKPKVRFSKKYRDYLK